LTLTFCIELHVKKAQDIMSLGCKTGLWCIACCGGLRLSFRWYSIIPTPEAMARFSLSNRWLHIKIICPTEAGYPSH